MQRETKLIGWFVLILGCSSILAGANILAGGANQADGLGCKVLCGLALLTSEILGNFAGQLVGGLLGVAVGTVFCLFGYRVLKDGK